MAQQEQKKPNILFIMADDIGWFNVSCYNHGIMGYRTPNIDRLAKEGAMFTDFYGQQSCTAGRAAFITGQSPIRTGLTKVGMPAAMLGLSFEDPSVGEFMKHFGYATGQFGKNHLGDRNEHLPTVHGFDEFFGNLYHLNAEEEPEYENYPKDPAFRKKFGPRGVLKCKASDKDDATVDAQFGKVGKQTIENTGPLTRKRMETVDEEFLASALDFLDRKTKSGEPWFCYFNPTRMHVFCSLQDFIPTFAAANGEPDLVEKVKKGYAMGGKTYKVHLDGVNLLPFLSGKEEKSPRDGFIYWSDDGECMAMRMGRFKVVFAEQRSMGLDVWREPLSPMRIP